MIIYVGRWDMFFGGVLEMEELNESEVKEELSREIEDYAKTHTREDNRMGVYSPQELEAEINNDLDEEDPFSLRYWVRFFD